MNSVLALITARGGSKGVPRKNITRVGGRPLIAWSISAAREAARLLERRTNGWAIDRIVVSNYSKEIRDVCIAEGADVPFLRPGNLAQDNSSHIDTVCHALEWLDKNQNYRPEWILLLQPTSPLRNSEDIMMAIESVREKDAPAVISVCETHDHPYLARKMDNEARLQEFLPCPLAYPRRQDLPAVYAMNGAIYLVRRKALLESRTFEPRGTVGYIMPVERSLQVDSAWDMPLLDLVLRDPGQSRSDLFQTINNEPADYLAPAVRRTSGRMSEK